MASTFSQTLRLELIGDGDQSGIWGQTTNTNLGTLLEQSITGVVSITMTDANYTLTNFNGVSDEARNAVLVVGGTNAAVRDIIAPLVEKLYVVRNNTSGGFAVNIRASSGSSVSVPNGATVWVYCDGTNFNAVGTESVGNFEVNGNLTVTGNTAITGTTTLTGALSASTGGFSGVLTAPTASVTTNNTQVATTAFVRSIIPAGVILMWSGSVASIPSGWLLCNGSSGTPDLRDRFIVGAGSSYAVGATGGSATNTLTTSELPSHTHSLSASGTTSSTNIDHTHSGTTGGMNSNASHTHSITDPGHRHQALDPADGTVQNVGIPAASFPVCAAYGSVPNGTFFTAPNTTGITVNSTNIDHTHSITTGGMNSNTTHTHTVTVTGTSGATGSGAAFTNLPPYYALAYIMKS
jgi:microcystin-dependent protein